MVLRFLRSERSERSWFYIYGRCSCANAVSRFCGFKVLCVVNVVNEAKVLYGFSFKDDALVAERSEAKVL